MAEGSILGNPSAAIGALLIAVLIWLHVVTENEYDYTIGVPLHVEEIPEDWVVANGLPSEIDITVKGPGKLFLFGMGSRDIRVILQAPTAKEKTKTYSLSKSDVKILTPTESKFPIDVQQIIDPRIVEIELDPLMTVELPLKNQIRIETSDGYIQVGDINIDPPKIKVSGPKRYIYPLDSVTLTPREFKDVQDDIDVQLPVDAPEGVNIVLSPSQAHVFAEIQIIGEREIPGIPVDVVNIPRRRKVIRAIADPSMLNMRIRGGADYIELLGPEDFKASVDYTKWKETKGAELTAEISPPRDVEAIDISPKTFNIIVISEQK